MNVLKALASETRYAIIKAIIKAGRICVEDIAATIGHTHSATSHQLAVLARHEIVTTKKTGRHQFYSLSKGENGKRAKRIVGLV